MRLLVEPVRSAAPRLRCLRGLLMARCMAPSLHHAATGRLWIIRKDGSIKSLETCAEHGQALAAKARATGALATYFFPQDGLGYVEQLAGECDSVGVSHVR